MFAFMYAYVSCMGSAPGVQKKGVSASETGGIDSSLLPSEYWEPNLCPLWEQQGVLTTEPCLSTQRYS